MPTLKIVNEKETKEIVVECVGSYVADNKMEGYSFFVEKVSHKTKATLEDLFADKNIVATQQVRGGGDFFNKALGVFTLGIVGYQVYKVFKHLTKKPSAKSGTQDTSSPNNTLGGRANEVRLGSRIEDIWGKEPKAYPSLLSNYVRFDENRNEIEVSLLCLGRGKYSVTDVKDGDYAVEKVTTTSVDFFEGGASITGTPSYTATPLASSQYPVLSVKKNTAIDAQQIFDETYGGVVFCDPTPGGIRQYGYPPKVTLISRSISDEYVGTATIKIRKQGVNWSNTAFASGGDVAIIGFAYAENGIDEYYNNSTCLTSSVSSVTDEYLFITITYQTSVALDTYWDKLTINVENVPAWGRSDYWNDLNDNNIVDPGEMEYNVITAPDDFNGTAHFIAADEILIPDGRPAIYHRDSFLSSKVDIEGDDSGFARYLLNFVCEQGTGGVVPTLLMEIETEDGFRTVEQITLTADALSNRRVGYTVDKTFTTSGVNPPVSFRVYTSGRYEFPIVFRETYQYLPVTGFSDAGTTLVKIERRFNSLYGASGEMKLSMMATRKIHPVVISGSSWSLNTSTLVADDKFDVVIANLHLDSFNGRRTVHSLDYVTLKSVRESVDTYFGSGFSSIGLTFDDKSQKYEDELDEILFGVNVNTLQVGSKIYTYLEKPDSIAMQFTHRDVISDTLKIQRVYRKDNEYNGVKLVFKNEDGYSVTLTYPTDGSVTNPYEFELKSVHTLAKANVRKMREWNKIKYQRKGCEFTSTNLGRLAVPGMVVSVVDTTREVKTDGELLYSYLSNGNTTVLGTSQPVNDGVTSIILTLENGDVSTYSCSKVDEFEVKLNTVVSDDIAYTDWERTKTRYQVVVGTEYDKYIVSSVERDNDGIKITCINYDPRYYQNDL